jgi:glycine oxidase
LSRPDVLVVGGGVIGCAIARRLAAAGVRTLLLERDQPGSHASWAAAGMLSPLAEADEPGPFLSLLLESRTLYPGLSAALLAETGIDVGYRDEGTLLVALTAGQEATLDARYRWQSAAGLPVERMTAGELREAEPALSPEVRAGLRFAGDHQVDSRLLAKALWAAAEAAGAEVRLGSAVQGVIVERGAVAGVRTADGGRVDAGAVVIAAGSWAGTIEGLPRPLPVMPVRGQLLAVHTRPPLFRQVVHAPDVYLVPRGDGRLILGATMERAGFEEAVTAGGVLSLLAPALQVAPALRDAPLVEWWCGLRPATPDGLPILGPDPEVSGLHYATGHYRNGILLTPVTAEIVAAAILGVARRGAGPFAADRFGPAPR